MAISATVRRNPSSVGGNTYLDAFDVAGSLLQASTRYQQVDSKVTWAGTWATNTSTSLSGGSYAGAGPGAIMLAKFDGTAIDLIGTLSPYGGIAEVSIDGAAPTDADFYGGAATSHKRRVWGVSGLSSGPHTIALTVTTRRNPASLGGMAYVDALDVSGTLAQAPTRYQQTDTRVGFSGPWTTTNRHVALGRQLRGRHQRSGDGASLRRHRSRPHRHPVLLRRHLDDLRRRGSADRRRLLRPRHEPQAASLGGLGTHCTVPTPCA